MSLLTVSEAVVAAAVSAVSSAAKTPSAPQQVTAATIRMVTNSLLNLVFITEPSIILSLYFPFYTLFLARLKAVNLRPPPL